MFISEVKSTKKGKQYKSTLIRKTYRKDGKVKNLTLANLSKLPEKEIELIKLALSGAPSFASISDISTSSSKEYGASFAFLHLARELGLDKMLYSQKVRWREDLLAVIIGRLVFQGSKLSLTNASKDTSLWELCGHEDGVPLNVNINCYQPMDELLRRQEKIQNTLVAKHMSKGCLVLYDITNTWMEGEYEDSELVAYGKAKDGKRGYKQIAIGLITNAEGCPVAVEVFRGNISDQMTVWGQAKKLAKSYGLSEVVFAGDRGMLTPKRIAEVSSLGFKTLTALTHPQIRSMLNDNVIQPELFDERNIVEVRDPEQPGIRFMLCKNPDTARRSTNTRRSLIKRTIEGLDKIKSSTRKQQRDKKCARIGKVLAKFKVGKFFIWQLDNDNNLIYELDEEKINHEEALDGCYVIRTDVDEETLDKQKTVFRYKQLTQVEQAFRNLKTVALELRPVYHKKDVRIKGHVFICMLAYYIQWHARKRLQPLFEKDGVGDERRWTFDVVMERLKSLRKETLKIKNIAISTKKNSPDDEQSEILKLLGVNLDVDRI